MGIVGVAGSMMLLIAGVGMPISMNHLVDKAYNTDFSYAKRLTVANYDQAAKTYQGQGVQISRARFSKDDGYNRLLIIVSDSDFVNARTADNKAIEEGSIYVTNRFAELAGIKKGETLKVTPYQDGKSYSFEVKRIVTSERLTKEPTSGQKPLRQLVVNLIRKPCWWIRPCQKMILKMTKISYRSLINQIKKRMLMIL